MYWIQFCGTEPYNCTGQFHTDFHELCRRTTLEVIPSVVSRPRRPVSPANAPNPVEEKAKAGKNAGKNQPPPPEPEPEQVIEESGGMYGGQHNAVQAS